MNDALSPLGRSILQRVGQAALGATAGVVTSVAATYHSQYRWFPDGCFVGRPRPWLAGVGSSLEMSAALEPLLANSLDDAGCVVFFFAFAAAAVPTRVSLRGQLIGALVVLGAVMAPMLMMLNDWRWSAPELVERCPYRGR